MTSRERIEAAFKHIQPDRTPVFEYVLLAPVAEELLGRPFIEYLGGTEAWLQYAAGVGFENALRQYARDKIDLAVLLGHDMLCIGPNPVPGEVYFYDPLEELGNHFELKAAGDPAARLAERNKKVAESMLGDLPENCYLVYYALREEMKKRDLDLPILAPAYFHGIWTDADLMQAMILEPVVAREHFALATERAMKVIGDYIKIRIDQVGIGGDFAGNRLLISPESYRTFIVPEVRKCARKLKEAGLYSVNATDGNLWPVIDDFLLGCEVDAYLEIDMSAGMDLKKLKKAYGDTILLFGNMDCGKILSFSSPEEIRRITFEILDAGMGNGGHIFTASNAITSSVPLKNYLAMVNAYREYFKLPKLCL
ncbi:MAG: uroporphyrinogen decarboxylase family protein [Spirochaetota bacterium]